MVKENQILNDLSYLWESLEISDNLKEKYFKNVHFHENHLTALNKAYAVAILTEWDEFLTYDWSKINSTLMKPIRVFDGRNILNEKYVFKNIG